MNIKFQYFAVMNSDVLEFFELAGRGSLARSEAIGSNSKVNNGVFALCRKLNWREHNLRNGKGDKPH